MKGILATVICAAATIYAATVFAENAAKEPEKKDFTPEFVAQCRARAEAGDAEAQVIYGTALANGWGVEKDLAKAVEWYTKAAKNGNAGGQVNLGVCYFFGRGVEKDKSKSIVWWRKAAEQGNADAQWLLGICYANGKGVEKDFPKAAEWFGQAAENGNPGGQFELGVCYFFGRGVEKDKSKGIEWWRKAAEQGFPDAQHNLGWCYANGEGVEKNMAKAVEWYLKAAKQGVAAAQHNLGACYADGEGVEKDMAKAVEWFTKAAEQGYALAQLCLGMQYANGEGVEKDMAKAAEWYTKAAKQGNADAQFNLGWCYENGKGLKKDFFKAVEWYTKAANQGDTRAQCNLGECYENGRGVKKDKSKAFEWYNKAAEQGDARAQYNIGVQWESQYKSFGEIGFARDRDMVQAVKHYAKAAEQGYAPAVDILDEIYDNPNHIKIGTHQEMETFKAALRAGREKLWKRAARLAKADARRWTTNETERFWVSAASSARRIVTKPRTGNADAQKGEGMLEAFGTQYMPNAYDNYGKARETAIEREQLLKEKFPDGAKSDTTGGGLYLEIAKETAKAVSDYFRRHDELCHFYLMHKAGIMTDAELAKLDEAKICVMLPLSGEMQEKWKTPTAPKPDELDFAHKYKPETFAAYERLKALYDEGVKQYDSLLEDALLLDAVRSGGVLAPLAAHLAEVSGKLQGIAKTLSEEKLLHEVEEITAEQLADSDSKFGIAIRAFEKTLPVRDYAQMWLAKNWTAKEWEGIAFREAPVFSLSRSMVAIPGRNYSICKFEVTQVLWKSVMGETPSQFKGADHPVDNVSWNDCQKFLGRLNALPEVKKSGVTYRLPTVNEWKSACRADAEKEYCRLADGSEITRDTLGEVAWYSDNSGSKTYPVGRKKPNAFGLYDMLGNVEEWTATVVGDGRVSCGGSWRDYCSPWNRETHSPDYRGNGSLGFRLAADR